MQGEHTAETVFGEIAEIYDEVRPEYPQQLIAELLEWSRLPSDGRMLEIGCGTGKATRLFAPHGYSMTCVDPAPGMLKVARRSCAEYPKVEFFEAKFEDWKLPAEPYDLVFSAQAFHWIDPDRGLAQVARALRLNGAFSLFWHVTDHPDTALRDALDDAYRRFAPNLSSPATGVKNTTQWPDVVRRSGLFGNVESRQYRWQAEYDADTWVRMLQTHSDHRVLEAAQLAQLVSTIRSAIESHGGVHKVNVTTELLMTKKA